MNEKQPFPNPDQEDVKSEKPGIRSVFRKLIGEKFFAKGEASKERWRLKSDRKTYSYDTLKVYEGKTITFDIMEKEVPKKATVNIIKVSVGRKSVERYFSNARAKVVGRVILSLNIKVEGHGSLSEEVSCVPKDFDRAPQFANGFEFEEKHGERKLRVEFGEVDILRAIAKALNNDITYDL